MITHGKSRSRGAYASWRGMKDRCNNPNHTCYKNYGGRGIKVCKRWRSFDCFYADMGEPLQGMTLERIDNNRGYYKENCRWATRKEQLYNQRRNRLLEFNGKVQPLVAWADELEMPWGRLRDRIDVLGWTMAEALRDNGAISHTKKSKLEEADIAIIRAAHRKRETGYSGNAREIAERFGVSDQTIYDIVNRRGKWTHVL